MLAMCPSCPTAIDARALVLSESFSLHVAFAVLPFAATLALIMWITRRVDRGEHD